MPDLNSVPPSPRNPVPNTVRQPASRQQMPPPPLPSSSSTNSLLLHQRAANRPPSETQLSDESRHVDLSSSRGSYSIAQASPSNDLNLPPGHNGAGYFLTRETAPGSRPNPTFGRESAPGSGPGPTRLPRPITAADLHLQLEKEQEAMVNFLSRELHALRDAHNSSVMSNASSTSASASGTESGTSASRRAPGHYRTSSNTSSVSFPARPSSVSVNSMGGISSPAPVRTYGPGGVSLSRQNSTSSQVRNPSPPPFPEESRPPHMQGRYTGPALVTQVGGVPPPLNSPVGPYSLSRSSSRQSDVNSRQPSGPSGYPPGSVAATPVTNSEPSPAMLPTTSRYEETAFYRRELDTVKRENEALKRQIRELEKMVRDRRASDASRAGSVAVGVPEDEVRVGESAASAGVQQQGGSS